MSRINRITRIISKEVGLNNPSSIVYDNQSRMLYLCDMSNHQVVRYNTENSNLDVLSGHCVDGHELIRPLAIAMDSEKTLFVTDIKQNKVFQWNDKRSEWEEVVILMEDDTQFNLPGSIAITSKEDLYIADFLNNRICRRKKDGRCSTVEEIQCRKPYGIFTDSEALYVTDYEGKSIKRYSYNENRCETIIEGYAAIAITEDVNGNLYYSRERELYRWTKATSKVELLLNTKIWKQYGFERLCHIGALVSIDAKTLLFTDTIKNCVYEISLQE